ncbi:hypothetical protein PhCBS80983_g05526 [Powellomyces hirtus]|uniref:Anaphase-promoting complex subunit 5 n=1 Tax=Powellomyces hirtus TaxID=109895 RepID=A0A507DUG1_9FUNG|nr:hypothetical protein PhCBS80983_g05526 [Powellomyces hirtus]
MQGIPVDEQHGSKDDAGSFWMLFLTPHKVAILVLFDLYISLPDDFPPESKHDVTRILLDEISSTSTMMDDPSLTDLTSKLPHIVTGEGITWEAMLLSKIDEASESINAMFDMFTSLEVALTANDMNSRFCPTSPFGLYVKLAISDLNQLKTDYSQACAFFEALKRYRIPESRSTLVEDYRAVRSTLDAEKYLDAQVKALEDNKARISPQDLQKKIDMYRHAPMDAKADWASYLNCLRTCDFQGALQSLLRYFMYCMKDQPEEVTKWVHHYALLNTACLYARFNHRELALETAERAVPLAQDMQDEACLMLLQNPSDIDTRSFHDGYRLHGEDEDAGPEHAPLRSFTALNHARYNLETSCKPSTVFDLLSSSINLNVEHSIEDVSGTERLLRAEAWRTYGNSTLAAMYAQMYLMGGKDWSTEDKPLGLCLLALHNGAQGEYQSAFEIIQKAKYMYPPFASGTAADRWISTMLDILFQRAIRRGEIKSAELYASHYAAVVEGDVEMESSVQLQHAILARKWGAPDKSFKLLSKIVDDLGGINTLKKPQLVECYLQFADLYYDSDNAISALPLVLSCMTITVENSLTFLRDRSAVMLAKVTNDIGYHSQASDALESVLPSVWSNGDMWLTAEAEMVCVEIRMTDPGFEKEGCTDPKLLNALILTVLRALQGFRKLEDLEAIQRSLTMLATLYELAGRDVEAEAAAKEVYDLDRLKSVRRRQSFPVNLADSIVERTPEADENMKVLFGL